MANVLTKMSPEVKKEFIKKLYNANTAKEPIGKILDELEQEIVKNRDNDLKESSKEPIYYDVRDKKPPLDKLCYMFFENKAHGGFGSWWIGKRISKYHCLMGETELVVLLDLTDRKEIGVGVTHWADLNELTKLLPDLCRRT